MGRGLLKDEAYDRIKQLIQTQVFKPGTFLSERELAARLGMSKTPVRSALERLQTEGFVQIAPQQGAVVREPSLHEIVDMIDFRIALEPYVLRRLVGRLSQRQLQRLRAAMLARRPVMATVVGRTERGPRVEVLGLYAVLSGSRHAQREGLELEVRITRMDPDEGRIVVSDRLVTRSQLPLI